MLAYLSASDKGTSYTQKKKQPEKCSTIRDQASLASARPNLKKI